jgi:small subunit ribosomal protein S7
LKREEDKTNMVKIFDLWETEEIVVNDPGLKRVISLKPKLVLKTHGRLKGDFSRTKINIVERLASLLAVSGHRNKKHIIMNKKSPGKYYTNMKTTIEALKIVEAKTKTNPVQILVKAIEVSSPKEEVTTIEYGGAKYPQAVDCSPSRRVALTLRLMVHGAADKAFGKKNKIKDTLANEIILASQGSGESAAFGKKNDLEKQANSAR